MSRVDGHDNRELGLTDLTQLVASLTGMHVRQAPSMSVSTAVEREKYSKIFLTFAGTNPLHQFLDFDAFALELNKDASAMEEGQSPV